MIQHEFHLNKFADFWLQTQNNIFLLIQNKFLIKKTKSREFKLRNKQDFFFLLTMKFDRKIQNIAKKKVRKIVDEIVNRQTTFKQTTFKQKTFK